MLRSGRGLPDVPRAAHADTCARVGGADTPVESATNPSLLRTCSGTIHLQPYQRALWAVFVIHLRISPAIIPPLQQGLYISLRDRGNALKKLKAWQQQDVQVVVATDGERILGLGESQARLSHADRALAGRVQAGQDAVWLQQALSSWQRHRVGVVCCTTPIMGYLGVLRSHACVRACVLNACVECSGQLSRTAHRTVLTCSMTELSAAFNTCIHNMHSTHARKGSTTMY